MDLRDLFILLFVSKFKPHYGLLSSASASGKKDEKTGHGTNKSNSNNNTDKDEKVTGIISRPKLAESNLF